MKLISDKRLLKNKNKPVLIRFLDHAMNSEAVPCAVVGFLIGVDEVSVRVVSWLSGFEDVESMNSNSETFSIVKSTITELKFLK